MQNTVLVLRILTTYTTYQSILCPNKAVILLQHNEFHHYTRNIF